MTMSMVNTEGPWRMEVVVYGERTWATNGLRFATKDDADAYGRALFSRWTGAQFMRSVDESTPMREPYTEGSETYP